MHHLIGRVQRTQVYWLVLFTSSFLRFQRTIKLLDENSIELVLRYNVVLRIVELKNTQVLLYILSNVVWYYLLEVHSFLAKEVSYYREGFFFHYDCVSTPHCYPENLFVLEGFDIHLRVLLISLHRDKVASNPVGILYGVFVTKGKLFFSCLVSLSLENKPLNLSFYVNMSFLLMRRS